MYNIFLSYQYLRKKWFVINEKDCKVLLQLYDIFENNIIFIDFIVEIRGIWIFMCEFGVVVVI